MEKIKREKTPLFHITRKQNVSNKEKWIIRCITIVVAILICALISIPMGTNFGTFFTKLFSANFSSATKFINLIEKMSILVLISLSLVPAFKMKFWNIGAEGQVIIGVLMCAITQKYIGQNMPLTNPAIRILYFIILFIICILSGAIWGLIPAIFKAKFNTNETLFTLMMNYIALILTKIVILCWDPSKGSIPLFDELTYLPNIGNIEGAINIFIVAVIAVILFIYLKYSKQGYEIAVVGESRNTAIYAGINYKKVIIRTMIISGALCGLCGCLLMAGEYNNLSTGIVSGKGFTGVMIAWISGLNPVEILIFSFLSSFIIKGASSINYNGSFPNILLGIVFFCLLASDFFVNYNIHCEKFENSKVGKFFSSLKKKKIDKNISIEEGK